MLGLGSWGGRAVAVVEGQVSQALGHKVHILRLCFLSVPFNCTCVAAACSLSKWFSTRKTLGLFGLRKTWEGSEGRERTVQNEFPPAALAAVLLSYQKTVSGQNSNTFQGYLIFRYCN